ncbi:hypothetical protein V8G54_016977 [Vigna mungo]|uniref:Uncharacterized protein n=1 Tax=Vigna mungo TaxID=3915 RepID=A0AAQ3NNM0_VIGMU
MLDNDDILLSLLPSLFSFVSQTLISQNLVQFECMAQLNAKLEGFKGERNKERKRCASFGGRKGCRRRDWEGEERDPQAEAPARVRESGYGFDEGREFGEENGTHAEEIAICEAINGLDSERELKFASTEKD